MRILALIAGAAVVVGACAREPEPLTISEITVQTELPAINSPAAVAYWQTLDADLETALAAQFAGRLDPLGSSIVVDVDELTLTSNFVAGATLEDAQLSGRVTLLNADGTTAAAYDVTATSSEAVAFIPDANTTVISPTSAEYYQAIVLAFARGAAEVIAAGGTAA